MAPMHWTHTRVRYGETDQMGVVYHANYLVYFELGRTELIRDLGFPYAQFEEDGIRLPVVSTALRFHNAARYDEEIAVGTRLTEITAVRVRFEYEVRSGDTLLAEGHTVLACVSPEGRPRRFPPAIRQRLEQAISA